MGQSKTLVYLLRPFPIFIEDPSRGYKKKLIHNPIYNLIYTRPDFIRPNNVFWKKPYADGWINDLYSEFMAFAFGLWDFPAKPRDKNTEVYLWAPSDHCLMDGGWKIWGWNYFSASTSGQYRNLNYLGNLADWRELQRKKTNDGVTVL